MEDVSYISRDLCYSRSYLQTVDFITSTWKRSQCEGALRCYIEAIVKRGLMYKLWDMSLWVELRNVRESCFWHFVIYMRWLCFYWISEWISKQRAKALKRRNAKLGPVMPPGVGVKSESKILINPCLESCRLLQKEIRWTLWEVNSWMIKKYVKDIKIGRATQGLILWNYIIFISAYLKHWAS